MGNSNTTEAVRFEHVSFTYADGAAPALRDVCLSIRRGEMAVVMGATGSGKSTLAKCINRTVPAFQPGDLEGKVSLFGRELEDEGVGDLAGTVGLVSQDFEAQLFATNVLQEVVFGMEQLRVPPAEMRTRLQEELRTVGLEGFEHRDPTTLSGGEKQRLAIAAVLALRPPILVFDEPTTDLDPLGKEEVFALLRAMRERDATLIVIEHETLAAEYADHLVILDHGRVAACGPPRELLARVDLLERHGIRPPDLSRIARRWGLPTVPESIDHAEAELRRAGPATPVDSRSEATQTAHLARPSPSVQWSGLPLISVRDVSFRYERETVLHDLSLDIAAGEFIALIGQNGSGKTTLAKHLNGLLHPQQGQVFFQQREIAALPLNEVAGHVGYVFQNPDHQLFASRVIDEVSFAPRNLGCTGEEVQDRVQEALAAVSLHGVDDVDPFLLGKGHRQRLAVASLLALRPRVLILDEPTTGLDYLEQRQMMDLLARLHADGLTVVIITHSPWVVAEYAERAVLLEEGRITFDGPLRALFADLDRLRRAHFRTPEVTRLGLRFGLVPLSVDDFARGLAAGAPLSNGGTGPS